MSGQCNWAWAQSIWYRWEQLKVRPLHHMLEQTKRDARREVEGKDLPSPALQG